MCNCEVGPQMTNCPESCKMFLLSFHDGIGIAGDRWKFIIECYDLSKFPVKGKRWQPLRGDAVYATYCLVMEPTTVGSLWLENDLHENELEFESYMGRSRKNVRVTSHGIHAEIHEIWTCVAPAAPPLFHAAVNPCFQGESPWNWSCNSVNLRKSTVTWMRRHYVFTVISRWSTFSSTVDVWNINCVIFSDTHCSFRPPICGTVHFMRGCQCTSKIMKMECQNLPLSTSLSVLTFQQLV